MAPARWGRPPVVPTPPVGALLVRPERIELPTCWFEASRSIQLSYGRRTLSSDSGPSHFPSAIFDFGPW